MSLADFEVVREEVSFGQGKLSLRGLALDDVAILIRENLNELDELLKLYAEEVDNRVAVSATAQYAVALVKESPALVARFIALACDEPELEHKARRLPIPTQIKAMEKIVELTFREAGGVKNFIESLMNLVAVVRPTAIQTGSLT